MANLVSPEDLQKWLMSIPPAELAKERYDVKADLSAMSDAPLDEHIVNELSHQLFDLTVKHNLDIDMIMSATHLPHEAILRLQSGNPFVTKEAFDILKSFADTLSKTGQIPSLEDTPSTKISQYDALLISNRVFNAVMTYGIDQDTIAKQSGLPYNDIARLSSENPFVVQKSLDILNAYLDQVDYWKGPKPDANHSDITD